MAGLVLGGIVLLVVLVTLFQAWRHPHLRRMAVRNLTVNKNMTILTIIGAMVGTTLITSTLLLQHSMDQSRERVMTEQFGAIMTDLPSQLQERLAGAFFTEEDVAELKEQGETSQVKQVKELLPTVAYQTTLLKRDASGKPLLLGPKTYLQGFERAQAANFDPAAARLIPDDLQADEIVLTKRIGERLEVGVGDTVDVLDHNQQPKTFKVRAVIEEVGLIGYRGIDKARSSALVRLEVARQLAGVPDGQYTNVLLSETLRHKVRSWMDQLLRKESLYSSTLLGYSTGWHEISVRQKADFELRHSLKFLPIFNIASINAVIIGVVLILNIFKMMAEERRQEIGILRATGMTRRDIKRVLRMEGLLYALASGGTGIIAGIGLSYLLLLQLGNSFREMLESTTEMVVHYSFAVDPLTLLTGFSIGVLLVFGCVSLVARKASKIPIVEAMQRADAGNGLVGAQQSVGRTAVGLFSLILALGFFLMTRTDMFREGVGSLPLLPLIIFLCGFLLVVLTVVSFVTSMGLVSSLIQWAFRPFHRWSGILRLALRYPESNRTRSGLLVLMFAMVFFLTSFAGVFSASWSQYFGGFDAQTATGGYDLLATATQRTIETAELQAMLETSSYVQRDSVSKMTAVWQTTVYWREGHGLHQYDFNGIDTAFAKGTQLSLSERLPGYDSDRAVWLAAATDPNVVIISERENGMLGHHFKLGDMLNIQLAEGTVSKKIIGFAAYTNEMYGYSASYGMFVSQEALRGLVNDQRGINSLLMLGVQGEAQFSEVAKGVEKEFTLQSIYPLVNPQQSFIIGRSFIQVFFSQFAGFSALATLIGIIGLMVVMLRVIRERRGQLGMLRAIGIEPRTLYWSLLIEGAMIGITGITLGLLIGLYIGVLMTSSITQSDMGNTIEIILPYGRLALYFCGALLVTLFCAMLSARKALRLSPAEASRYVS